MSINYQTILSLDDAVNETLGLLYGQDLAYDSQYDRYRIIARFINRALRANALEHEWSFYHDVKLLTPVPGQKWVSLEVLDNTEAEPPEYATWRVRQTGDDSIRFVNIDGDPLAWAYFLPRDALHKTRNQPGWYASVVRDRIYFSKELPAMEFTYTIEVPVMREPYRFQIPPEPATPEDPLPVFQEYERVKPVDFHYPDVITARAAYMYALTDPVVQPRAQTLEANYKDLMYQVIERDDRYTDSPLENNYLVPVQNDIFGETTFAPWPLADRRR